MKYPFAIACKVNVSVNSDKMEWIIYEIKELNTNIGRG
jgi:hypothetical protein